MQHGDDDAGGAAATGGGAAGDDEPRAAFAEGPRERRGGGEDARGGRHRHRRRSAHGVQDGAVAARVVAVSAKAAAREKSRRRGRDRADSREKERSRLARSRDRRRREQRTRRRRQSGPAKHARDEAAARKWVENRQARRERALKGDAGVAPGALGASARRYITGTDEDSEGSDGSHPRIREAPQRERNRQFPSPDKTAAVLRVDEPPASTAPAPGLPGGRPRINVSPRALDGSPKAPGTPSTPIAARASAARRAREAAERRQSAHAALGSPASTRAVAPGAADSPMEAVPLLSFSDATTRPSPSAKATPPPPAPTSEAGGRQNGEGPVKAASELSRRPRPAVHPPGERERRAASTAERPPLARSRDAPVGAADDEPDAATDEPDSPASGSVSPVATVTSNLTGLALPSIAEKDATIHSLQHEVTALKGLVTKLAAFVPDADTAAEVAAATTGRSHTSQTELGSPGRRASFHGTRGPAYVARRSSVGFAEPVGQRSDAHAPRGAPPAIGSGPGVPLSARSYNSFGSHTSFASQPAPPTGRPAYARRSAPGPATAFDGHASMPSVLPSDARRAAASVGGGSLGHALPRGPGAAARRATWQQSQGALGRPDRFVPPGRGLQRGPRGQPPVVARGTPAVASSVSPRSLLSTTSPAHSFRGAASPASYAPHASEARVHPVGPGPAHPRPARGGAQARPRRSSDVSMRHLNSARSPSPPPGVHPPGNLSGSEHLPHLASAGSRRMSSPGPGSAPLSRAGTWHPRPMTRRPSGWKPPPPAGTPPAEAKVRGSAHLELPHGAARPPASGLRTAGSSVVAPASATERPPPSAAQAREALRRASWHSGSQPSGGAPPTAAGDGAVAAQQSRAPGKCDGCGQLRSRFRCLQCSGDDAARRVCGACFQAEHSRQGRRLHHFVAA